MSERPAGRDGPEKQSDVDRRFAEIIEDLLPGLPIPWDRPTPHEPSIHDLTDGTADEVDRPETDSAPGELDPPPDETGTAPGEPDPLAELPAQWRMPPSGSASFLDDDGDTFVPPPPRPLPTSDEDIGFWTMLACLIGGPAWLLYLFFFDSYARSLWWLLACAVFVAGVIQLIMRSPKSREDDDDDGAVL